MSNSTTNSSCNSSCNSAGNSTRSSTCNSSRNSKRNSPLCFLVDARCKEKTKQLHETLYNKYCFSTPSWDDETFATVFPARMIRPKGFSLDPQHYEHNCSSAPARTVALESISHWWQYLHSTWPGVWWALWNLQNADELRTSSLWEIWKYLKKSRT